MAPRILVVEDEEDQRNVLELVLQRAGFAPVLAADGGQGRRILKKERIDLVILDWHLPDMSGEKFVRWMRRRPGIRFLPVLMLTIRAKPELEARDLESGADDFMSKPYEIGELIARIERLLRLWRRMRRHP